jgi:hypothetical protein
VQYFFCRHFFYHLLNKINDSEEEAVEQARAEKKYRKLNKRKQVSRSFESLKLHRHTIEVSVWQGRWRFVFEKFTRSLLFTLINDVEVFNNNLMLHLHIVEDDRTWSLKTQIYPTDGIEVDEERERKIEKCFSIAIDLKYSYIINK